MGNKIKGIKEENIYKGNSAFETVKSKINRSEGKGWNLSTPCQQCQTETFCHEDEQPEEKFQHQRQSQLILFFGERSADENQYRDLSPSLRTFNRIVHALLTAYRD